MHNLSSSILCGILSVVSLSAAMVDFDRRHRQQTGNNDVQLEPNRSNRCVTLPLCLHRSVNVLELMLGRDWFQPVSPIRRCFDRFDSSATGGQNACIIPNRILQYYCLQLNQNPNSIPFSPFAIALPMELIAHLQLNEPIQIGHWTIPQGIID